MSKKIIKVPVYNFSGEEITMQSKRVYSNWIFKITCPKCGEIETFQPNTYTLLYVPDTYKHVHFHCEKCEHEAYSFLLEDIIDGEAHLYKHPDFDGKISIVHLVEEETDVL